MRTEDEEQQPETGDEVDLEENQKETEALSQIDKESKEKLMVSGGHVQMIYC